MRILKYIQHLPLNDRIHILCSIQPTEDTHGDGGCCQDVCEMVEPDTSQILGLLPSILQTREARDPSKILSEDLWLTNNVLSSHTKIVKIRFNKLFFWFNYQNYHNFLPSKNVFIFFPINYFFNLIMWCMNCQKDHKKLQCWEGCKKHGNVGGGVVVRCCCGGGGGVGEDVPMLEVRVIHIHDPISAAWTLHSGRTQGHLKNTIKSFDLFRQAGWNTFHIQKAHCWHQTYLVARVNSVTKF